LKKSNFLIYGLSIVAAYYIFGRVQLGQKVKLLFKRIRLVGKGLAKKLELNFEIQNPTGQTGTISAITGEVLVNNQMIADFSNFAEQKIAANSISPLQIIATPNIGIIQLLTQKNLTKSGIKYTIRGNANFNGIIAPFQYDAQLV